MNEADIKYWRYVAQESLPASAPMYERVVATYDALAEARAEVERLTRALEDQHTATDAMWNERAELRAQLSTAQADTKRLTKLVCDAAKKCRIDFKYADARGVLEAVSRLLNPTLVAEIAKQHDATRGAEGGGNG